MFKVGDQVVRNPNDHDPLGRSARNVRTLYEQGKHAPMTVVVVDAESVHGTMLEVEGVVGQRVRAFHYRFTKATTVHLDEGLFQI